MLVLTRKPNQSIMIGDEIEITVLAIGRDKVRFGIRAPREIPVYRTELYLNIQAEREANAGDVSARATPARTRAAARSQDRG